MKAHKIPEHSTAVRVSFDSIDAAARTVQDTLAVSQSPPPRDRGCWFLVLPFLKLIYFLLFFPGRLSWSIVAVGTSSVGKTIGLRIPGVCSWSAQCPAGTGGTAPDRLAWRRSDAIRCFDGPVSIRRAHCCA